LTIATLISLLTQILTLILPDRRVLEFHNHYWYITPYWWRHVGELLDLEIWSALAIGGIYLIAKDFDREIRSGTLDLVNLSPAQPWEIMLGKLLGVPVLIYWVVLLALPLHTIALVQMAVPNAWIWDAIGLILIGLLDLGAIFATLTASLPPLVLSLVLSTIGCSGLAMITSSQIGQRMSGSYARFGIYFLDEWLTILTVAANFLAIGYTLWISIQSWYPHLNSRSPRQLGTRSFFVHAFGLFFYLVLLARAPQAILVMTIGISITITLALNEESRSINSTIR
jgi:ABC-type transport system involved in cytochrome c biogenesis permease component